jgi:hypothetical protein
MFEEESLGLRSKYRHQRNYLDRAWEQPNTVCQSHQYSVVYLMVSSLASFAEKAFAVAALSGAATVLGRVAHVSPDNQTRPLNDLLA